MYVLIMNDLSHCRPGVLSYSVFSKSQILKKLLSPIFTASVRSLRRHHEITG
jgi:hypothetical protein